MSVWGSVDGTIVLRQLGGGFTIDPNEINRFLVEFLKNVEGSEGGLFINTSLVEDVSTLEFIGNYSFVTYKKVVVCFYGKLRDVDMFLENHESFFEKLVNDFQVALSQLMSRNIYCEVINLRYAEDDKDYYIYDVEYSEDDIPTLKTEFVERI